MQSLGSIAKSDSGISQLAHLLHSELAFAT